ncbi:membrane protein [Nocardioides psychrotolerans]|uniref:Uncharacterized conserved protein YlxW, UPF0749 family n=1 Tax=Nocardioides psychrotolerans TaxID=1005945 RepID=A0A1I3GHZ3_9ACTN|nr:DUF881 domain-containing protein [Nocardioides psychrotolerans]GEP39303.1 membrane protein [Nocardioides psychrotolerans]SFI23086.1 Uncharacterized conserved protein YlxW, UPF0749 family [Nocardioides psychrotolerans]
MTSGSHARPAGAAPEDPRLEGQLQGEYAEQHARADADADVVGGGSEHPHSARLRAKRGVWRIGTPLVVLLSGSLFTISAYSSEGTDLRPGRYTDLASLVQNEADQYDDLKSRLDDLTSEVELLAADVDDRAVNRFQSRIEELEDPAGLTPRQGPGVSVTLSDAPEDVINSTGRDLNLLVVHQQDIQAVVNAMWRGGATAVTIQGQRIVSTTGIKCHGNAVLLQGVPYAQPYVIEAVGDPDELEDTVRNDADVAYYLARAEIPDISVGWDFEVEDDIEAPAYDGLLSRSYAEPLR